MLQHLEGELDDLFDRCTRLILEDSFDGLGDRGGWEAEHLEGFACLVIDLAVEGGWSLFA